MIVSMNGVDFLTTLEDLKANRRISYEAKALFDPFRGQKVTLKFLYGSSIRTFANRFDSAYDGGYTITAKIEDRKIEFSLLLDQSENQLVESLESGDPLEWRTSPDRPNVRARHAPSTRGAIGLCSLQSAAR